MITFPRILTLLAVLILAGLVLLVRLEVASTNSGGVCDRTSQVGNAIAAASGVESCSEVSTIHLSDVTSLDLSEQALSGLDADDFAGLVRLETLDLSHNSLTTLPAGVFDDLYLLRTLHLNDNLLAALPEDVFDQLFLLDDLTLDGNPSLELPDGMFHDFSRFDGILSNGDVTTDTGDYPHIDRFLTKHGITSPEEFIASLSPLYKERFTVVFRSQAAAQDHVSGDYPRIISFGADGRFTFAWNTDPDAPSTFRDSVEFLRQNDDDWSTGIIDFSGDSPSITEPASCAVCHGSLNKPLWGKWYRWLGTENPFYNAEERETASPSMQRMLESSDPRVQPLDFSASIFLRGDYTARFLRSPGREGYVFATGEAGALWSWRHAEVLFHRLKTRHRDFRQYAEELTCSTPTDALIWKFNEEFDQREHNLFVPANIDENMIRDNGMFRGDGLTSHSYHYQSDGSIAEAVSFLALVELWQQEPIVRKLYRETSNEDTVPSRVSEPFVDAYLHYGEGEATAEDELIQKIRLHFGYGSRAALDARASQNEVLPEGTVLSASFWDGHTEVMRSRVCEALRDGKPGSLRTSENGGNVVLNWDAPGYQADSVTGYQVLRSVSGAAPDVHVDDTGTTDTAWTDENPPAGDPIYVVRAIYDDYYLGPASVPTNIRATGAPGIVGTVQAGSTLMADTSGIGDANGLTTVSYSYRWISHDGTSDSHIANAAGSTYTLVAADEGETIKVKVSFTDDAGHDETLTSEATDPVAPLPNSPATGAPAITGTVQVGETLTVDTSDIGDDDGLTTVSYSYQWISNDGTSDSDIANAAGSTRTLVAADGGKTIKVKVSFTDDAGHDETLTSEATDPVAPLPNSPATGAPAISGTIRAGEILTASTSGIEDADGMDNVTYSYQWLADDTDIAGATSASYTLTASEEGNAIKVRVSFTDDAGHSETLTSPPLDPSRPYGLTTVVSDGAVVLTWNPPVGFQFLYDYQILRYRPELGETEPIVYVDTGTAETTYTDTDVEPGALYVYRVKAANYFNSLSQASEPVEIRTPESLTSAVTDPVASPPTTLTASIHDAPESHDGENSFTFELRFSETPEPDFSYEVLRDQALTASGGTVTKARRLDPPGNVRWEITVEPSSDADVTIVLPETADCDDQGAICTEDGRMLSAEVTLTVAGPEEEEEQTPPENNPATGAPTISGTAQVGQTLTADVTGIADEDGLDNVSYAYQWLAEDADIAGATGATHTLTSSEQGKAIKVRVSFTDDEGNDESLTSAATDAAAPPPTPLTASIHEAPESHDGENSFTFELRFSEEPDPAFRYEVLRDQALTASGGTVNKARRLDPPGNVRWEITVEPSSGADVTIVLAETADCDDQGAICTADGRMLSAEVTLTVAGPVEEEEQTSPQNNPATGTPTISGTAQVGQTLAADTDGIADADGLDNATYSYQWLAADDDISGATSSRYKLTDSEEGKPIKVTVSFTDDAGNEESLTSVATAAVATAAVGTALTAKFLDTPSSHGGQTAFTFELRLSEEPVSSFSHETLRDQAFTASGGTVTNVRRLDPPGNVRWEITVEPSSDADVTIVLPVTTDCAGQGAICTEDGRMLSPEVTLVVAGFSLDDFDAGDDQAVLASALIRVGDRGRKNNETQDRAWYASETSAWHASGQLRDGSLAWNGMTLNRVVYFSDTGSFRFNEADDIHIGESFSAGGVNRELTVWIQTQTEAVSFLAKDNIRNSASGYITFEAPTAIRSVLEGVSEGDLVIIAVSAPANS